MIEMVLSGFLFLFIIVTLIISERFGYSVISDLDSETKLQEINKDPNKFKIGTILALIEHGTIIALAITLFFAFNSFNITLAYIWTISRVTEGLINFYNEKNYWGLLNTARHYTASTGAEKKSLIDLGRSILKTKNRVLAFAQILFSIGTLSYSILFVTSDTVPVPELIGWFGILASFLYGFANGIIIIKPDKARRFFVVGLIILIFELILGVWLLISPFI
ncbi:hypothetical protein AC477_04445 [miscellaneous Crenarchaeota group-1 archaeon SG8-32-1]|uniref:DUF4386 domain-containing protein n=1 Tax=miscellaneous Crenarchaeota group-1 archaeon SG8-32-1 TaxID=1685124 RepID=A0A0M0BS80_9ARCH|nr:MAG: hypothetical protein AC477_04445 [miscellaneous Crenarchaeota group-1 archaeon SG8-32-1]